MKKTTLLEEQNLLMLMTMPEDPNSAPEAREYLMLYRTKELRKFRKHLVEEVVQDKELARREEYAVREATQAREEHKRCRNATQVQKKIQMRS